MTVLAGTGHRPDKLPNKETGYKLPNSTYIYVCQQIEKHLLELKPEKVLSGMALGYDQYFAFVAHKLGIPFVAVVPFEGQEKAWPISSQKTYQTLINKASERIVVCEGGYAPNKMQIRNQYLVDNCDVLLACFDGSSGGTANCIKYAKEINRKIFYISPKPCSSTTHST